MEDLLFSVKTIFPLLLIMATGFLSRRLGWIDDHSTRKANACVFKIFLPLLIVFNLVDMKIEASIDWMTLLFGFLGSLSCFGILFFITPLFVKERRDRGVFIQGFCRSNYAIFGIPLVAMMYPENNAIASLMVAVVVPVFNVMATIALMVYGTEKRSSPWQIVKGVLLNPLIIATAAGFLLWGFKISLPEILEKPLRQMGSISTPLALFCLGATLDFSKAKANGRLLTLSVLGKLVFVPMVYLTLAVLMGIRDVSLATLIAVFASPVSVSSFPMAQQMGGNDDLAGGQVVFTTAFSIITVFCWVYLFKALGFIG